MTFSMPTFKVLEGLPKGAFRAINLSPREGDAGTTRKYNPKAVILTNRGR